jgi:hypothetical protein
MVALVRALASTIILVSVPWDFMASIVN